MPGLFTITAPTNTIRLDDEREGEAAFTVFNASGRSLRGRAEVQAEDPAAMNWLALAGDAEQDFDIASARQYTVQIRVPADAPAGSYPFRLDMVGVEDPDRDYVRGPAASFGVPEPQPRSRPFPWWILAIVAGILIVGTAIVVFILSRGPAEQTLALEVDAQMSGVRLVGACADGLQGEAWILNEGIRVGVTPVEDCPPPSAATALLSFDIGDLGEATVTDARLDLSDHDIIGDPFGLFGPLIVDEVSFPQIRPGAPVLETQVGELARLQASPQELDVTQALNDAIDRGSRRFQVRLGFEIGGVDFRHVDEALAAQTYYITWNAGDIILDVAWTE